MKIVQVSTYDLRGGGPQAAYRLNQGLRNLGYDSTLFVSQGNQNDSTCYVFHPLMDFKNRVQRRIRKILIDAWVKRYPDSRKLGYERFSTEKTIYGNTFLHQLPDADIINFHWITDFVDLECFIPVMTKAKLVWTLHDMNAFTGGCHYDALCGKFINRCGSCPQLQSSNAIDLSRQVWLRKHYVYSKINPARFNLVAPSYWMADQIAKSSLLNRFTVKVIPNGVDPNEFFPRDRSFSRSTLGIPNNANVIMFGVNSNVKRKGFSYLVSALMNLEKINNVFLLSVGNNIPYLENSIPHTHVGFINNPRLLSLIYSAADVFVIPSLQDNLPNTILESFSCGTPVIGFDTGGISELIDSGLNGYLVPVGDSKALKYSLEYFFSNSVQRNEMSQRCRTKAIVEYSLEIQSHRYAELYREISGN